MEIRLLIATLDILGTIFIAYAALRVHHRVLAEHKVDEKVFRSMKIEQKLGILGVIMIVIGYFVELMWLIV